MNLDGPDALGTAAKRRPAQQGPGVESGKTLFAKRFMSHNLESLALEILSLK